MGQLEARVSRFCREERLFPAGSAVLVACSGGADSVALLHVLSELAELLAIRLHVGHFNHRLRETESDEDARFVGELAGNLDIPCTIVAWDNPAPGQPSLEARARKARYAFLDAAARQNGASVIALGHTADDQVETVVLNLIRGAGLRGIRGILPLRGRYARPLLEVSRGEIIEYLAGRQLLFRQDSTNFDPVWRRNRIRLSVVPQFGELNPRLAEDIGRMCRILRAENAVLEAMTTETMAQLNIRPEAPLSLDALRTLSPALRRRVLRELIDSSIPGAETGSRHVEAVMALISGSRRHTRVCLPGGFRFIRRGKTVMLSQEESRRPEHMAPDSRSLPETGEIWFGRWRLAAETSADPDRIAKLRAAVVADGTEAFDAGAIGGPPLVRAAAPGDRMQPLGFRGRRKVTDILREALIPPEERRGWPVLTDGDTVLWVVGIRRSNHALLRKDTAVAWCVEVLDSPINR